MARLDPYAACPCGSGKKARWCCEFIFDDINKAFEFEKEGQHEAALRLIDELVAKNPTNPEVWGRKAQLLYNQQRFEDAETALQKAFEQSPRYPFGHYLQGRFRLAEGEIAGALILLRRAAEYYDPEAKFMLADIYTMIADSEMKLNRPVAARAALDLAVSCAPAEQELRQSVEQLFGEKSTLPPSARRPYTFLPLPESASAQQRAAWPRAIPSSGKITDAVAAFRTLTEQDERDCAGWYNLGLSWAWLGNNAAAVEALEKYVSLETNEGRATAAWALAELLRCGHGMEDQADIVDNIALFILKSADHFSHFIDKLQKEKRLLGGEFDEHNKVLTGLIIEQSPLASTVKQNPRLGASLMFANGMLILRNTWKESLDRIADEAKEALGQTVGESRRSLGPAGFSDLFSEAMVFPVGATDQPQAEIRIRAGFERFFEEAWLNRPLKSLGGISPLDAAGHAVLRKKLLGTIQFLQECAAANHMPYDFDRLRRKLNLLESQPALSGSGLPDISALGAAELAQLPIDTLGGEQLETAYQTALHLDARELAGKFARTLVSMPARPDKPDRFVWFNHLIQLDQNAGNFETALKQVDEGNKDDCEHNEGKRRNDYELRRAQLQMKLGRVEDAQGTFDRLIASNPSELRFQGSAAEAMLSSRQGKKALAYAEKGLAGARQQNSRDMEEYFRELVSAAQKQG